MAAAPPPTAQAGARPAATPGSNTPAATNAPAAAPASTQQPGGYVNLFEQAAQQA